MVVLVASLCTRDGKDLLSRQFRAMSKAQVEALLTSFPKLSNLRTQHTSIETNTVRYVYQPLDELYMVLITTKGSNILQDIDTLHLFTQVVTSICNNNVDEKEVLRNAFELISAFDEIITLGYRETLSLPQVRNILEMESQEEKIQDIISRNKEHEASEERKRRARQLEMQRREMAKFAPRQSSGGFASNFGSQYQSVPTSSPDISATSHYNDYKTETAKKTVPAMKGKGMQLGGKANARLKTALSNEISLADDNASRTLLASNAPTAATDSPSGHIPPSSSEGIEVSLVETSVAKANRDGHLESLEVQGQLNLQISDSSISRVQIEVHSDDSDGTQFKSHPNMDRNLFKNQHTIGLRDTSRSFPLNQQMSVLRWRLQSKDNISLPISVNFWPSPLGDGTTDVNIEYEVDLNKSTITDVVIVIPLPVSGSIPEVREIDGNYQITAAGFEWRPSIEQVENGRLEFNIEGDDVEVFYPVEYRYKTAKPICTIEVVDVKLVDMQESVSYSSLVAAETSIILS